MFVRYEMPDVTGETRDERNARFGITDKAVDWDIPDDGLYLWEWYWQISGKLLRVADGVAVPIPWSEYRAWRKETRRIVRPFEYDILIDMDAAFVAETNAELQRSRAIQKEQSEKDAKRKGGKGKG
jgi:hypothetical protein